MFILAKIHQAVADENARLRKINEDLVRKNETISDDLRTRYERDTDMIKYDHDRELVRRTDNFNDQVMKKDHEIAKLQNEVDRVRSEGVARLSLQEDIHMDELLAEQEKYNAKVEAMEIAYKAKDEALDTEMHADIAQRTALREKALAEAEKEGTKIIQEALENVQVVYRNALDLLIARIKEVPTMTSTEIINLIKASTENYPALPETLTSTSSSK